MRAMLTCVIVLCTAASCLDYYLDSLQKIWLNQEETYIYTQLPILWRDVGMRMAVTGGSFFMKQTRQRIWEHCIRCTALINKKPSLWGIGVIAARSPELLPLSQLDGIISLGDGVLLFIPDAQPVSSERQPPGLQHCWVTHNAICLIRERRINIYRRHRLFSKGSGQKMISGMDISTNPDDIE